jgi:hypothetical protein
MTLQPADAYRAKAIECQRQAGEAHSPSEKESWLKLAAEWDALAIEANLSGQLLWVVKER